MEALLGDSLLSHDSPIPVPTSVLAGKTVGLYFSGHWCGPCRRFTPDLAAVYKQVKDAGHDFEVVFVSSDEDDASFKAYYEEMPWLALPYSDRARKAELSQRFNVSGIPKLVLLRPDASLITTDGRSGVASEGAAGFPWAPVPLHELLGDLLECHTGQPARLAQETYVALYFSASWCPPCKRFTPKLVEAYNALKPGASAYLAVVFVSSDQDQAGFDSYRSHMPWLAVPYSDARRRQALKTAAGVEGIPMLQLFQRDPATGALSLVNENARGAVEAGRNFPWLPPPVADMNEDSSVVKALNRGPVLALLLDGCASDVAASAVAALLEACPKSETNTLFVCAAQEAGAVSDRTRELCRLGEPDKAAGPILLHLDAPNDTFYVRTGFAAAAPMCNGDVCTMPSGTSLDAAAVRTFLADIQDGKVEKGTMES